MEVVLSAMHAYDGIKIIVYYINPTYQPEQFTRKQAHHGGSWTLYDISNAGSQHISLNTMQQGINGTCIQNILALSSNSGY